MFVTLPVFAKQELKIALSISNSSQRAAYYNLAQKFEEEHPDTQITMTSFTSEIYKYKFPQMFSSNQYDILYWHAGERLFRYIEQGKIASINDIFSTKEIATMFDKAVIDSISFEEKVYSFPMSYYQTGFYYHKPLFSKFGLTEPRDWGDFLEICEVLKQNNVSPIYISTGSNWPATAWFDYLNLRLNGKDFHMNIMRGEVYNTITEARSITQFFDRNSKKVYADKVMPIIDEFMLNLDINAAQKALEKVRLRIFTTSPIHKNQTNI